MKINKLVGVSVLALQLGFATSAFSQSFNIEDATAVEGTATVTVPWQLNAGGGVEGIGIDVFFDDTMLTPVLDNGGPQVENCFNNVTAQVPPSCQQINATTIRITISNFPGTELESADGSITFEIDAGALVGDSSDLLLEVASVVPAATVALDEGSVTIIDTDANLTITPAAHDFGTQDINDPDQTFDFTLGNSGVDDSLTVGTASVGGAPYSVSGNCDGQTLAPGGSCVVTVTFAPTAAGTFSDTLSVTSDANNVSADLDGVATATADIVINPPFGPVNLGFGAPGDSIGANGTISNNGSADADVSCTLTGDTGVISTTPSPLAAMVGAGETVNFSLACDLPAEAEEGETFSATLSCDIDGEPAGTHEISCGVSTFEPLPVPTMQAWALALFALMMLLAGAIGIRFFRA